MCKFMRRLFHLPPKPRHSRVLEGVQANTLTDPIAEMHSFIPR